MSISSQSLGAFVDAFRQASSRPLTPSGTTTSVKASLPMFRAKAQPQIFCDGFAVVPVMKKYAQSSSSATWSRMTTTPSSIASLKTLVATAPSPPPWINAATALP